MSASAVTIRNATPEDAAACGRICFDAFSAINTEHNFPPEIPTAEAAEGLLGMLFSHPRFHGVVAEVDGKIVGSNCLDERSAIAGVGPLTVDPTAQNKGVGRVLMDAAMDRAREADYAGVRLVQAAFHCRSLSLYAKLGFEVREPLAVMRGPAIARPLIGFEVRPATTADLDAANRVCQKVHGFDRGGELADAIGQGTAIVVERNGAITAYATSFGYFGHSVGESTADVVALISAATDFPPPGILVPMRNSQLFQWCLKSGLRMVQPMTLMTTGLYNEPVGAYLPSILY